MAGEVEMSVRGPEAYATARRAIEEMERLQIWPTPLNYELWIHCVAEPEGELAQEIERLIAEGSVITEAVSESLAAHYLPKNRLTEEIRDTGDQLNRQLEQVSKAIDAAQKSSIAYGKTLAGAAQDLTEEQAPPALKRMVDGLAAATRRVQKENTTLEARLSDSTNEVRRLREHLEQVRRDAMTDGLTNLANRKAFDEHLASLCADPNALLSLAVLDIDHFKRFNDTWGHQTGDQVLRYVASVIGRVGSAPRLSARYGGEEFAVLFPGETAGQVHAVLEEVRVEIGSRTLKRRSTNQDLGAVTLSAGIAQRGSGEGIGALIERADAALYDSKRAGRNRITNAESLQPAA